MTLQENSTLFKRAKREEFLFIFPTDFDISSNKSVDKHAGVCIWQLRRRLNEEWSFQMKRTLG